MECVCSFANQLKDMCYLHPFPDGLTTIVRKEGPTGLFRGTSLALFGVSNGAIQFVVYEKMKAWGFERRRKQHERAGQLYDINTDKLVSHQCFLSPPDISSEPSNQSNLSYMIMSISSKYTALSITYPYQVVRSRIQVSISTSRLPLHQRFLPNTERRSSASLPDDTHNHQANMGGGGFERLLPGFGYELRPCAAWDMYNVCGI